MTIPTTALDFCSEPVDVFCPICGKQIFVSGQQKNSCHHTLFVADSAAKMWSWYQNYPTQQFQTAVEDKFSKACDNGFYGDLKSYTATIPPNTAAELAAETLSNKSAFMLSITTSDIGCGGMYNGTIHVIFDYLATTPKLIQPFSSDQQTR